ncbi:MAG: cytidine deaminase [Treponema sp.]|nr:cytidine deaminase [Treponema sp.]
MGSQADWDEYFLNIASEVAKKSKDPSSQCGCVIADKKHRVISVGYNGLVQGADESKLTLSERPMKYRFVVHSEMNAVLFAHQDLSECTVYNNMATCDNCLKYCLQAGIKRFVYKSLRLHSHLSGASKSMTNFESDLAIVRLLAAVPDVETLNISNGKTYSQDIIDSYEKDSQEYKELIKWV